MHHWKLDLIHPRTEHPGRAIEQPSLLDERPQLEKECLWIVAGNAEQNMPQQFELASQGQ